MFKFSKPHHRRLISVVGFVAAVQSIGAVTFHALEDWTWIQSIYFTVVTTTTVGYGDLHPTTDASRLFATVYILIGAGVLVTAVSYIGAYIIELREDEITEAVSQKLEND